MNAITTLSPAELRKAANIQEKIQELQKKLNQILGTTVESIPSEAPKITKRKMSAAGRAAIRAAQKARWAKIKAKTAKPVKKARKKMSAAAKARLSALAKARWAKAKKAGKTKL
jgi:hypothetical protein